MAIQKGHERNFDTLLRAADESNLALMECTDTVTGKPVVVICAVNRVGGGYQFVPLARMFDDNPYNEVLPPRGGQEN